MLLSNRIAAALRLVLVLSLLAATVVPGSAQSALEGQSIGVAWPSRGGLDDEAWEDLLAELAVDSPRIVALGR